MTSERRPSALWASGAPMAVSACWLRASSMVTSRIRNTQFSIPQCPATVSAACLGRPSRRQDWLRHKPGRGGFSHCGGRCLPHYTHGPDGANRRSLPVHPTPRGAAPPPGPRACLPACTAWAGDQGQCPDWLINQGKRSPDHLDIRDLQRCQ